MLRRKPIQTGGKAAGAGIGPKRSPISDWNHRRDCLAHGPHTRGRVTTVAQTGMPVSDKPIRAAPLSLELAATAQERKP
jgi:hypothetical protein